MLIEVGGALIGAFVDCWGIVYEGFMLISLKANKQSCGPPVASKMRSHLVILKALRDLRTPAGQRRYAPRPKCVRI